MQCTAEHVDYAGRTPPSSLHLHKPAKGNLINGGGDLRVLSNCCHCTSGDTKILWSKSDHRLTECGDQSMRAVADGIIFGDLVRVQHHLQPIKHITPW
jgi:hypothetical protein